MKLKERAYRLYWRWLVLAFLWLSDRLRTFDPYLGYLIEDKEGKVIAIKVLGQRQWRDANSRFVGNDLPQIILDKDKVKDPYTLEGQRYEQEIKYRALGQLNSKYADALKRDEKVHGVGQSGKTEHQSMNPAYDALYTDPRSVEPGQRDLGHIDDLKIGKQELTNPELGQE